MTKKLSIVAATILATAGICCALEARAADGAVPGPRRALVAWDFIETDCQLTWWGITLYGVIDAGFTYQNSRRAVGYAKPSGFRIHRPEI